MLFRSCSLTADETITVAVQEAQKMVNRFREDHLYIDAVILEGVGKYINSIADAVDLRQLDAENVSVVIAQDPAWAAKDEAYRTHAAVGSALDVYKRQGLPYVVRKGIRYRHNRRSRRFRFVRLFGITPAPISDRKSTRLNSSHITRSRMPSSA